MSITIFNTTVPVYTFVQKIELTIEFTYTRVLYIYYEICNMNVK